MKEEARKAIEKLWAFLHGQEMFLPEDYKTIERALNECEAKATPKKLIEIEKWHYLCPSCNETVVIRTSEDDSTVWFKAYKRHCQNCGQALDWAEERVTEAEGKK